ncbi:MAG: hypothetical protein WD042_14565 [Phycisphaeraceae bacterium]
MQVKIGCKVVHHAWQVVLQLVEVAIPRSLLAAILGRIERMADQGAENAQRDPCQALYYAESLVA